MVLVMEVERSEEQVESPHKSHSTPLSHHRSHSTPYTLHKSHSPPLEHSHELPLPQLEQGQAGTQQHTGLQQHTGTQEQLEPQPPEQAQPVMALVMEMERSEEQVEMEARPQWSHDAVTLKGKMASAEDILSSELSLHFQEHSCDEQYVGQFCEHEANDPEDSHSRLVNELRVN
ncbi:Zinc finger protein 639 [Fukomys damarensis]|uniref:Zinc finger protein 639 n=1 Tax=Fukomys damarensis TaxID=885580 RepID=A0A091DZN3_FUKDA|nr:Zinc finger protein 639 [Fukomys damarensis]